MEKREFVKKLGFITASAITVPLAGCKNDNLGNSEKGVTLDNRYPKIETSISTKSNTNEQASKMRLVIGSDHAGFPLKGPLLNVLKLWGYDVKDVGSFTPDPVDFPDIAVLLAEEILSGRAERGIMVCGTGVGASIACNKIQGIRASLSHDTYSAHQCVEHDNVNVLCIGAQIIGQSVAEEIINNFLQAKFSTEEQFRRRVKKLDQFDLVPPKMNNP